MKYSTTAGAWNFGLCATRSREPRQARKGATVPGTPRVPQITRSSSPVKNSKVNSSQAKVKQLHPGPITSISFPAILFLIRGTGREARVKSTFNFQLIHFLPQLET